MKDVGLKGTVTFFGDVGLKGTVTFFGDGKKSLGVSMFHVEHFNFYQGTVPRGKDYTTHRKGTGNQQGVWRENRLGYAEVWKWG